MQDESEPVYTKNRATRRFKLQLPVSLHEKNGTAKTIPGITRDISSQGVCFLIDAKVEPGSVIEFTLTLPAEITLTEPIQVLCEARVLRVEENQPGGRTAIAAHIQRYEYLPTPAP